MCWPTIEFLTGRSNRKLSNRSVRAVAFARKGSVCLRTIGRSDTILWLRDRDEVVLLITVRKKWVRPDRSQEINSRSEHDMTSSGESPSNDQLFAEVYEDLRRLARGVKGARGDLTWSPTALVNEAYLRLTASGRFKAESTDHLKHTVIRAVKHLLIDAARRQAALRRGGGSFPIRKIPLDEVSAHSAEFDPEQLVVLADALDELAKGNEMGALIFDCRYFGGMALSDIAAFCGVSEKTVQRSLRLARASVSVALRRQGFA